MTEFETKVEQALISFWKQKGYGPTRRELMVCVGCHSFRSMNAALMRMRDADIVQWEDGMSRTLRVVGND